MIVLKENKKPKNQQSAYSKWPFYHRSLEVRIRHWKGHVNSPSQKRSQTRRIVSNNFFGGTRFSGHFFPGWTAEGMDATYFRLHLFGHRSEDNCGCDSVKSHQLMQGLFKFNGTYFEWIKVDTKVILSYGNFRGICLYTWCVVWVGVNNASCDTWCYPP